MDFTSDSQFWRLNYLYPTIKVTANRDTLEPCLTGQCLSGETDKGTFAGINYNFEAGGFTQVLKISDDNSNYIFAPTLQAYIFANQNWLSPPTRSLTFEFTVINPHLQRIMTFKLTAVLTNSGVYQVNLSSQSLPLKLFQKTDWVQFVAIVVLCLGLIIIIDKEAKQYY
jgi:hypothetical protein